MAMGRYCAVGWSLSVTVALLLFCSGCDSAAGKMETFAKAVSNFSAILKEDRIIEAAERERYSARIESAFKAMTVGDYANDSRLQDVYKEAEKLTKWITDFNSHPNNAAFRLIPKLYPGDRSDNEVVRGHLIRQLWIVGFDEFLTKCEKAGVKTK